MNTNLPPLTLRPRPRLVLTNERLNSLKSQVQTEPFSAQLFERLRQEAEAALKLPLPVRTLEGKRLLGVSRRVLANVLRFALLWRFTSDGRYADAARREMLAATTFSDWNPSHFLDTAEMAMALAIGYDWLYDTLPVAERLEVETALVDKALRPSLDPKCDWVSRQNNWNPVCHAGMSFAALAIADTQPELATTIVHRAQANIGLVAEAYGPDGAYDEGPMYWDYGTSFLVLFCAVIESATGTPFDPGIPGLMASAEYMMHVTAPTGIFYNYSDCRPSRSPTAPLFWFANKLNRPELTDIDRAKLVGPEASPGEGDRLLPFALIWHQPQPESHANSLPQFWAGGGRTPVALMRTSWTDPNASFLGIKGGSPSVSHAHMDTGSFVFESDGVRWAVDLPMQDYHSLESAGVNLWDLTQNSDRWSVFRIGVEGHNVLRINGSPQPINSLAPLRVVKTDHAVGRVVVDTTSLYPDAVTSALRTATLNDDGSAEIVDAWQASAGDLAVQWQWLTAAEVEVKPDGFLLRSGGKLLSVLFEPSEETMSIAVEKVNDLLRPYDAPNPGISRVLVLLRMPAGRAGLLLARLKPGSLLT